MLEDRGPCLLVSTHVVKGENFNFELEILAN